MSNDDDRKRLVRVEVKLTNLGRAFGIDLTQRPAPNQPDQPVYIADGTVYAVPTTTVSELMLAALRYPDWHEDDTEVPVIVAGQIIATIDPHKTAEKLRINNGKDKRED